MTRSTSGRGDVGEVPSSAVVVDALRRLSHVHRTILVATHVRGRTVSAAAAELGMPVATAKSLTHLALRALREALALPAWPGPAHAAVGCYALGLLDEGETLAFAEHLDGCTHCHEELASLAPVVAGLSGVTSAQPGRGAAAAPLPRSRRLSLPSVAQLLITVAATTTLLAAGVATGMTRSGPWTGPDSAAGATHTAVRQVSVIDPSTRARADFELDGRPWGTWVTLTVTNVEGPKDCRLLVVDTGGRTRVLSSWQVPGTDAGATPRAQRVQATTDLGAGSIDRFVIESIDATGGSTSLVTAHVEST